MLKEAGLDNYKSWVQAWVTKIESADKRGDTKDIYREVKMLAGSTHNTFSETIFVENIDQSLHFVSYSLHIIECYMVRVCVCVCVCVCSFTVK